MDTLQELFRKYYAKTASKAELTALADLILQTDARRLQKLIVDTGEQEEFPGEKFAPSKVNEIVDSILTYKEKVIMHAHQNDAPVHSVHFLRTAWFRYAAAVLLLFGVGAYFYTNQQKKNNRTATTSIPVKKDILPGRDRAILTLSNGQQVVLNSAASETIKDGTLSIENNNGQLIYFGRRSPGEGGKKGDLVAMNTMTTPNGGQYQLTLADGTKVWLNAASSITYPTAFTGHERGVRITGEAYLEVAKDEDQPFRVEVNGRKIEVLGTRFNVNAYSDEPVFKTSLLDGSIRIGGQLLKPGQAYVDGKIIATNVYQDIAWKNGFFSFNDADIQTVMRQLSRWYDVNVRYEGRVTAKVFNGDIGRSLTLSQVLNVLSQIGIQYRIENKTITIQP